MITPDWFVRLWRCGRRFGLGLASTPAAAQKLSDRAMTIVVPTTAGTSMDFLARIIGDEIKQRWGQTVVVENKAGASHTIAIQAVARAEPDGHTLLSAANTLTTNVGFFKTMPYDPVKSLTPVIEMARGSLALAVHPSIPAATVARADRLCKGAARSEINYASTGPGTPQHLAMELFASRAGIKLTHVPYPGSAGATRELVGGFVKAMFLPSHQAIPLARGASRFGCWRSAARQRFAQVPDVPDALRGRVRGDRGRFLVRAARARRHAVRCRRPPQPRGDEMIATRNFSRPSPRRGCGRWAGRRRRSPT